jgi:hypothetical protein
METREVLLKADKVKVAFERIDGGKIRVSTSSWVLSSIIKDAHVVTIPPPPPVQGLGSAGGFKLMLEDWGGLGSQALVRAANALVDATPM